jgi:hypothetical protein
MLSLYELARRHGLNTSQIAILGILRDLAEDGRATISKAELGLVVGIGERQVSNIIRALEGKELIQRQRVAGASRGANCYVIGPANRKSISERKAVADEKPVAERQPVSGNQLPNGNQATDFELVGEPEPKKKAPHTLKRKTTPTQTSESQTQSKDSGMKGGLGGKTSRVKLRFFATDATLPTELTPRMLQDAVKHGFLNGSAEQQFKEFRDYHIGRGTEMADVEAYFRTWLGKSNEFAGRNQRREIRSAPSTSSSGVRPFLYGG